MGISKFEQKLYVDALWDLTDESGPAVLDQLNKSSMIIHYDLVERLRVNILLIRYKRSEKLPDLLVADLLNALAAPQVETSLLYTLAAYESLLLKATHQDIIEAAKKHPRYFDIAEEEKSITLASDVVADLFYNSPDVTTYMNGEYVNSVKLFQFCRSNRLYPCLIVMRNIHGEVVRNDDGSIWTQPALASSSRGLPSYVRNGNTPAGIFTIDSVMPAADQQISFGKFRRMILNFVPKSKDEVLFKSLIPASSHESDWWKPSITARDIGRNLFRIHGTGKINNDPTTPYYPFMRTSGCVAQRENTYEGITFKDQRDLLDQIMLAMDLTPRYENEPKIKGILYLVEIDDKDQAVTPADLALRGIE